MLAIEEQINNLLIEASEEETKTSSSVLSNENLIPILDTSHSISKQFTKFGNARMGASINLRLSSTNAFSCFSPHLNPIGF